MKSIGKLILALVLMVPAAAFAATPRLTAVSPSGGHNGDQITASGDNLSAESVERLYLTNGRKDYRVSIKEQSAGSIRFSIPARIRPGYYNLMLQTAGAGAALLEQPISCQVLAEGEELIEPAEEELEIIEQEVSEEEEKAAEKRFKEMEKEAKKKKKKKKKG